jgi:hypothetical protein
MQILRLGLVLIVIAISFFTFSPYYTEFYNSDCSIHILMSEHFNFTNDWYFWGAKRLGSLLPIISYLIHTITQLNTLVSSTITLYGLLIGGFFLLARKIQNPLLLTTFAISVFIPNVYYKETVMLGQSYVAQFFCMAVFWHYFNKFLHSVHTETSAKKTFNLSIVWFILSVWSSELSLLPIVLMYVYLFLLSTYNSDFKEKFQKTYQGKTLNAFRWQGILTFLGGALFILLAKLSAYGQDYGGKQIVNWKEFIRSLDIYLPKLYRAYFFLNQKPIHSVGSILFTLALALGIFFWFKNFFKGLKKPFEASTLMGLMAYSMGSFVSVSIWVYNNQCDTRFFSLAIPLAILSMVYYLEENKLNQKPIHYFLAALLFVSVFLIGTSSVIENRKPSSYQATYKACEGLHAGIVGYYWNSYNLAATHPSKLVAAAEPSTGFIRRADMLEKLLKMDSIIFFKNLILDKHPDSLFVFGAKLLNTHQPITLLDTLDGSIYKYAGNTFTFTPEEFSLYTSHTTKIDNQWYWESPLHEEISLHFPVACKIFEGDYQFRFYIKSLGKDITQPLDTLGKIGLYDDRAFRREIPVLAKDISQKDSLGNSYIDLPYSIPKGLRNYTLTLTSLNAPLLVSKIKIITQRVVYRNYGLRY